jgi:hypothetical protein
MRWRRCGCLSPDRHGRQRERYRKYTRSECQVHSAGGGPRARAGAHPAVIIYRAADGTRGSCELWVPKTLSPHATWHTRGSGRRAGPGTEYAFRSRPQSNAHARRPICGAASGASGDPARAYLPSPSCDPDRVTVTSEDYGSCPSLNHDWRQDSGTTENTSSSDGDDHFHIGLDLPVSMFAPCSLGRSGRPRQHAASGGPLRIQATAQDSSSRQVLALLDTR